MIVIQKKYWFFALFCILTIILMYILRSVPNTHIDFNPEQIAELHDLSAQGNATAISKLISYYLISKDTDKAVDVFRQYKDVSYNFKTGYYYFLSTRTSDYKDEMISVATELANDARDLSDFYTNGRFIEKYLQKAAYWNKIAECNKQGISITECQTKENR
jgi:hypothetical protein